MPEAPINGGWVDTHLHILPGVDDGPANLEAALAMAEVAIADGTAAVITTAHANYQFQFSFEQVLALGQQMQAALGGRLKFYPGCELHLSFENVQAATANSRLYTLNASRYLLCEFPEFFDRGAMHEVLRRFRDLGLVPVLAHPERNQVFQRTPEALLDYLRLGCLAQVTASSFIGRFGKQAQQSSADLLAKGWIHLVASDAHSADKRSPRLSHAFAHIEREAGRDTALALCIANPAAILDDRDLPYQPDFAAAKKRSFWARLRS